MHLFKPRFKISLALVPIALLFLGFGLDSGSSTEKWMGSQDEQMKMTKAEFDRLPDDHVFTYKGRKITKAQILARFHKMRQNSRRIGKEITPEELKRISEREHLAKVKQDNIKVQEYMKTQPLQVKKDPSRQMVVSNKPGITSTFSVPPLSPGEDIFIKGFGFGEREPRVVLIGDFPRGSIGLRIMEFKPGYIHAQVPDIEGVPDQSVELAVFVNNVGSNHWPTTFEAKRVYGFLEAKDFVVLFCHPGYPRSSDICNQFASDGRGDVGSLMTTHMYSSLEVGKDIVTAEVKNGWYFKDLSFRWQQANQTSWGPNSQVALVDGFRPNTESLNLNINWMYIGLGGIRYNLDLTIKGPAGIPYK